MSTHNIPHAPASAGGNLTLHERVVPVTYTRVDDDILYLHADTKDFAARVLCYLTTRPKPWTLTEAAISVKFGVDERKVRRAMHWLTEQGYVRSRRRRARFYRMDAGLVIPNVYVWDWDVYKVPRMNPHWVKAQGRQTVQEDQEEVG